jgi:histone deacetylase 6
MAAELPTGLVYDERFLLHEAPHDHPEHPGRLTAIWEHLRAGELLERCVRVAAREATREELVAVHTEVHVDAVESTARASAVHIDADTYANRHSALAARLAAGSVADLAARVVRGELGSAFALVRPPGHHAESGRAMGFCLFNNVAVATRVAQREGAHRVLIADWDVHHGNGTQEIFYEDPEVLYLSIHEWPLYPGTGAVLEVGGGAGRGHTVNLPYPAGLGDAEYLWAFDRLFLPIARAFGPDLVLVSCGFDASENDPLAMMRVTRAGFAQMASRLRALAGGKLVLALEGGYDLEAISLAAEACLRVLLGESPPPVDPAAANERAVRLVEKAREVHRPFWSDL